MKALSIRQPWGHAIMHLGKDIENRSWSTKLRGRLAVHVSQTVTKDEIEIFKDFTKDILPEMPDFSKMPLGAIIGTVQLVDCVQDHNSPWFVGDYGFMLARPIALKNPIPIKGARGFWDVPVEIDQLIADTVPLTCEECGLVDLFVKSRVFTTPRWDGFQTVTFDLCDDCDYTSICEDCGLRYDIHYDCICYHKKCCELCK